MLDKNALAPMLDAPIPGQGLTAPLGDRPWQQPPMLPTPEEALSYYVERLTGEEQVPQMLDLLELGVPVDTLVDTVQLTGVMEGIHSVDVGILISPALTELVSQIATKADIKHKVEGEETNPNASSRAEIALQLQKLREEDGDKLNLIDKNTTPIENNVDEMPEEKPAGLMARR
tara:strand:+ start:649 stop:1170 length:522 start_codon:yes stop_codon:yes gene_type:complete